MSKKRICSFSSAQTERTMRGFASATRSSATSTLRFIIQKVPLNTSKGERSIYISCNEIEMKRLIN